METLKLFDANNNVYTNAVLGKQIWELTKSFPNEKLGTIIKSRTTSTETEGRKSYWTYVFLHVCGLKKELDNLVKEKSNGWANKVSNDRYEKSNCWGSKVNNDK